MSNISYYLIFSVTWLFSILPLWILYRISDVLYFIMFYVVKYRKSTVYSNLTSSFPGKTSLEINTIAKGFYRHFSDFFVEFVKGLTMPLSIHGKRYFFTNTGLIRELEQQGRSIALVSAHYNNWEWGNILPLIMRHENLIIYRPLKNRAVDRLTIRIRSHYGMKMLPMEHVYREAINVKNRGELFLIWFLADQRPPRSNSFWTTFLNHEASFYMGAEKIARKLDMVVVFLDIQKKKRGHYEITFKKLFDRGKLTKDNEITLACVNEMEKQISRQPEYWLWSHKRFKHKMPEGIDIIRR